MSISLSSNISIVAGFDVSLMSICNYISAQQGYGNICDCETLVNMGDQHLDALISGFIDENVVPALTGIPVGNCGAPGWKDAIRLATASIRIGTDGFQINTDALVDFALEQTLCYLLTELKSQIIGPLYTTIVREVRNFLRQACHGIAGTTAPDVAIEQSVLPPTISAMADPRLAHQQAGGGTIVYSGQTSKKSSPAVWIAAAGAVAVAFFAVSRRR